MKILCGIIPLLITCILANRMVNANEHTNGIDYENSIRTLQYREVVLDLSGKFMEGNFDENIENLTMFLKKNKQECDRFYKKRKFGDMREQPHVNSLNFKNNKISDDNVIVLASVLEKFPHISYLNLNNNEIRNKGAMVLAANRTLTSLSLCSNKIEEEGATAFLNALECSNNLHLQNLTLPFDINKELKNKILNLVEKNRRRHNSVISILAD